MKSIICLYITILFSGIATAQRSAETQTQYRTDVSVKSQLTGTSIPNQQYRTPGTKSAVKPAGERVQQSSARQIRNNAEPGMVYKKTDTKGSNAAPATRGSGNVLPSDKKAEPVKQPAPETPKNLTQ